MLDDFASANASILWQEAAKHFCGEGLAGGADNHSLRALLLKLETVEMGRQLAEVLVNICVGGSWPQARKKDEGLISDDTCARCRARDASAQ
eukprot:1776813-Pyramimonas_sp.AAC.1